MESVFFLFYLQFYICREGGLGVEGGTIIAQAQVCEFP